LSQNFNKNYFGEGILIVFSVLFALFIDKTFENFKTRQEKKIALESIIKEIERNQNILNSWLKNHNTITNRISDSIENNADSLKLKLTEDDFFNLMVFTNNKPLINDLLTNTAWESAKTTGIISEFEYDTIQQLTQLYDIQVILVDRTIMKIIDLFHDKKTHDLNDLDKTLILLRLRFWELTGQERSMSYLYKKALESLSGNN
jgi:hypothetical protein